jgi:hypothetical protein
VESGLLFGDVGASIAGGIIFNTAGLANGMQFRTGGNTTRMTLDGAGRLGVATGTPTATLHVGGGGGNDAVILPSQAIDSVEMFDEPGVAADSEGVIAEAMSTTVATLLSRSIDVPAAGFVLAIGSCQATANHVNGTQSMATFGVSTTATAFPSDQDVQVSLPATAATGAYNWPVATQHVFTVAAAGSQTFHLLAQEASAQWSASEMQLTLVYFATDYGVVSVVSSRDVEGGGAAEGIGAASKANGLRLDEERLWRERAEVRRELEELRALKAELHALRAEMDGWLGSGASGE